MNELTREVLLAEVKRQLELLTATTNKCVFCLGGHRTHSDGCAISRMRQAFGEES